MNLLRNLSAGAALWLAIAACATRDEDTFLVLGGLCVIASAVSLLAGLREVPHG